ncbi:hypothetical protein MIND_00035100 [Mycena indigotica]|uniref:Uncharacterized protein n=1 Tax=Mycena indigotica TaxID=2126181 RepID=A0A8H6TEG5_9AGAR|nr:uncharacterized protein MIND_00035100 [Mycena indigotica]KAF7315207.1 hypothetical protein MIND_00035100 [Mycena indigotica]
MVGRLCKAVPLDLALLPPNPSVARPEHRARQKGASCEDMSSLLLIYDCRRLLRRLQLNGAHSRSTRPQFFPSLNFAVHPRWRCLNSRTQL